MRQLLLTVVLIAGLVPPAPAAVTGKEIVYHGGGEDLHGYLAYDDARPGPHPGILVVHEWWGHNAYARRRARMLAEMGYTALAVDMYGQGRKTGHPKTAGEFAGEVRGNMAVARERFDAALETLRARPDVDPEHIAAIGYCFGGGIVLEMAREGVGLDAVVSFHGSLRTDNTARPGDVKARVLVAHGAADSFVPEADVEAFRREMEEAGADYRFESYPGAKHSFTNPEADHFAREYGMNVGYDEEADNASWNLMKEFLYETFAVPAVEDKPQS